MPLKPIDYSNTTFYRIVCNDLNIKDCYIGHTTNFIKRKQYHKVCCNNQLSKKTNAKIYQFIRENGGWENWSMIMIEQISCENFNEACKLERKFLEEFNGTLNMIIPSRTKKEWNEDNKDKIKEYQKEYNKNYKIEIEKKEQYKEQYKKNYEINKDELNKKRREKYLLNKDELNKKRREKNNI